MVHEGGHLLELLVRRYTATSAANTSEMGNICETQNADFDTNDLVIIRCLSVEHARQHHRSLPVEQSIDPRDSDLFDEDLTTSKRLLTACSPVFTSMIKACPGKQQILVVEKFERSDMAVFLRFATFYAFPMEEDSEHKIDVSLSKASVMRLMPIVHYYKCGQLWMVLIDWITDHPDLELAATAEQVKGDSVDWKLSILKKLLDEAMTAPKNIEVICFKGKYASTPLGELETGMELSQAKMVLLAKLSSKTSVRMMQLMVKTKANAHVVPPPNDPVRKKAR